MHECVFKVSTDVNRKFIPTVRASMCDIHHRLRAGASIWKAGLAVVVLAVMGRVKPSQQHVYGPGTASGGGCMSVHKCTFSGS